MREVNQITEVCKPISLDNIPKLRDPKDKIVLETAVTIPIDSIISGDLDLLVLREFQKILMVTPSQFLERYQKT